MKIRLIAYFRLATTKAIINHGLKQNLNAPTRDSISITMALEEYFDKYKQRGKA